MTLPRLFQPLRSALAPPFTSTANYSETTSAPGTETQQPSVFLPEPDRTTRCRPATIEGAYHRRSRSATVHLRRSGTGAHRFRFGPRRSTRRPASGRRERSPPFRSLNSVARSGSEEPSRENTPRSPPGTPASKWGAFLPPGSGFAGSSPQASVLPPVRVRVLSRHRFKPVDARDVRMVQRCEKLGFPLEPREALFVFRKLFRKDFDRDVEVKLPVPSPVDLSMPPLPMGEVTS